MDTLFHYCSTDSFCSIINSRSIWLSSLPLSNDSLEGRLLTRCFKRLYRRNALADDVWSDFSWVVESVEGLVHGLGFCLSDRPDLLSQWRGYASDGTGVAIGFSREYFEKLRTLKSTPEYSQLVLDKVVYLEADHDSLVEPTFNEIVDYLRVHTGLFNTSRRTGNGLYDPSDPEGYRKHLRVIFLKVMTLLPKLYVLKGAAFSEESEWRLVSTVISQPDTTCEFRSKGDRLIPFRSYPLNIDGVRAIDRVFLGPKHQTPPDLVKSFLSIKGFDNVEVIPSSATYR